MYTGLISEVGTLVERTDDQLRVRAPKSSAQLCAGASIAIDGVCLTVTRVQGEHFEAELSNETRLRSCFDDRSGNDPVNLELPLTAGQALDGHLVQGHIDAVGKVTRIEGEGRGMRVWIKPPTRVIEDLVAKGSIAIDGVSLTIAEVVRDRFSVALIPSTLRDTTFASLQVGRRVNLETDLIGKYAARHSLRAREAMSRAVRQSPWAGQMWGSTGIEKVVQHFSSGGIVLVWDEEREQEVDIICPGYRLRPETFAFILTEACGYPCVPCDRERLERLEIPPLAGAGDLQKTAFHLPIDLARNTGTGVSAAERAATVRRLAEPDARPEDFLRPGHVNPLGAARGGLRERTGHTEITVALCEAAELPTVGVCCEIMLRTGEMARYDAAERLALDWGVPLISIAELVGRL